MDEEKTTTETEPEATTETEDDGNKPSSTPLLDVANAAAERMEKANAETARLQDKQDAIDARKALGGLSEAGTETKKEFTDEEIASRKRIKAVADVSNSSWGEKYE